MVGYPVPQCTYLFQIGIDLLSQGGNGGLGIVVRENLTEVTVP